MRTCLATNQTKRAVPVNFVLPQPIAPAQPGRPLEEELGQGRSRMLGQEPPSAGRCWPQQQEGAGHLGHVSGLGCVTAHSSVKSMEIIFKGLWASQDASCRAIGCCRTHRFLLFFPISAGLTSGCYFEGVFRVAALFPDLCSIWLIPIWR